MRTKFAAVVLSMTALALLLASQDGFTQPGRQGKGGFGDPSRMFDMLAKGQPNIVISQVQWPRLRESLTEFAQSRNITDGKISRELYLDFVKAKFAGGNFGKGFKINVNIPDNPIPNLTPTPAPQANIIDAWNQMAEWEFKKRDANGDGLLNLDEMPGKLRDDLARWDVNHDNLIDFPEFKAYFLVSMQGRFDRDLQKLNPAANPVAIAIIIEEEWDKRPTVFRAGKLPKELPKWFTELDNPPNGNADGQVSLAEWNRAKKNIDEFAKYDRNEDGLLTPEEVLRVENLVRLASGSKDSSTLDLSTGKAPSSETGKDKGKKGGRGDWMKRFNFNK